MTDHLPECPWPKKPCGPDHEPMHDRQPLFCVACLTECICDELRACEQRVLEEIDREDFVLNEGDPFREAYRAGYSKGVRDAHESASWCQDSDEMLQAIIGLLNMPPPPPLPPSVSVPEKWRP